MKRGMKTLLIVLIVVVVIAVAAFICYRLFIFAPDKGGMENPAPPAAVTEEPGDEIILDGPGMVYDPSVEAAGTYVRTDDETCRVTIENGHMTYYKGDERLYDGICYYDYSTCIICPDAESVDGLSGFGIGMEQTLYGIPAGSDEIDENIVFNQPMK